LNRKPTCRDLFIIGWNWPIDRICRLGDIVMRIVAHLAVAVLSALLVGRAEVTE
jgi:hypothetical protein